MQTSQYFQEINLEWKGIHSIKPIVQKWSEIIYVEKRFQHKKNGIDFFVDAELKETEKNSNLIVTKWGYDLNQSFHCITGFLLFDLIPWWSLMQSFFEKKLLLRPWLPYPCLLLSESNLRRHSDKGRPTALNYSIFGEEIISHHIWKHESDSDSQFIESYSYQKGKTILLDTTSNHGGMTNPGYLKSDLRAICNMGFHENFQHCKNTIEQAELKGFMQELREYR